MSNAVEIPERWAAQPLHAPPLPCINELATALAKAQGQMKNASLNKVNPHFRSKYADLAAIIEAIRKPLSDNNICWTHTTELRGSAFVLVTRLIHSSGQMLVSERPLPMGKPQEMGSAETYAKRYSLSSLCGIAADEDDDGNRATEGKSAGNGEAISEEQVEHLQSLIVETATDIAKFCAYMKTDRIEHIPADQFHRAAAMLEKKRAQAA